jgi:hypothetical protein
MSATLLWCGHDLAGDCEEANAAAAERLTMAAQPQDFLIHKFRVNNSDEVDPKLMATSYSTKLSNWATHVNN